MRNKKRRLCGILPLPMAMRFADGGGNPAATETEAAAEKSDARENQSAAQLPPNEAAGEKAANTYTEQQLQEARAAAVEEYKRHLEEAKDYEKMTPEEKVAYLEQQRAEEKLERYASEKLAVAGLSPALARYVKSGNEKEIDAGVLQLKELLDKDVQAGVEARFRNMGYEPRGSGIGKVSGKAARPRGITIE